MGLIGKLKEILFDEETVEIPVITKEEVEAKKEKKVKKTIDAETNVDKKKKSIDTSNEVIIEKIETPKRETPSTIDNGEDLFDMPKLKEEAKEEKKINTFTFPVIDDDTVAKRITKERREENVSEKRTTTSQPHEKRVSGYTNAYDYSYGKYKGDYKSSRESNQEYLSKTIEAKEEKKAFTPSPIISPVYGVLNENYKKEDIVAKVDYKENKSTLDLDSVRRKAYGTLEDEIEESLSLDKDKEEVLVEATNNDDEGICIDDLLIDSGEKYEGANTVKEEYYSDAELFRSLSEEEPKVEQSEAKRTLRDIDTLEPDETKVREENIKVEKTMDKPKDERDKEDEEDLFDLIDSLYDGRGEE